MPARIGLPELALDLGEQLDLVEWVAVLAGNRV
jgi:hypothetical protein